MSGGGRRVEDRAGMDGQVGGYMGLVVEGVKAIGRDRAGFEKGGLR